VRDWGVQPAWVTGDSWYSRIENLKFLRHEQLGFLFGIATNRQVSLAKGTVVRVQALTIPEAGLTVYLKEFGTVKVFCQNFKDEGRYYILWLPDGEALNALPRSKFLNLHDCHWQIEPFHRVIKQVCNIERFQVRTKSAIKTHCFCALQAFCQLQTMRMEGLIANLYEVSRQLLIPVVCQFIQDNLAKLVPI
jgi:hypothetical protein